MSARLVIAPLVCGVLLVAATGCGSNARAPVEDRAARTPAVAPPSHIRPAPRYRVRQLSTNAATLPDYSGLQ